MNRRIKIKCPFCGCNQLESTEVSGNLRSEFSWEHDALYCHKCGATFTIWNELEIRGQVTKRGI